MNLKFKFGIRKAMVRLVSSSISLVILIFTALPNHISQSISTGFDFILKSVRYSSIENRIPAKFSDLNKIIKSDSNSLFISRNSDFLFCAISFIAILPPATYSSDFFAFQITKNSFGLSEKYIRWRKNFAIISIFFNNFERINRFLRFA